MTNSELAPSAARIDTLEDLRKHVQWAIALEHATLPPYLCALYSIDPERNPEAVQVMSSVFVEEMIHLALAANLLNAVGGRPRLDTPHMLPDHPRRLPHGDRSLELSLRPFRDGGARDVPPSRTSGAAWCSARRRPLRDHRAVLQRDRGRVAPAERLDRRGSGLLSRPRTPGRGRSVPAQQRASGPGRRPRPALAALDEIVEQGEGTGRGGVWDGDRDIFHPHREEVGHYYRLLELKLGRRYRRGNTPLTGPTGEAVTVDLDGVYPMRPNPRLADHAPDSPIRTAQEEFNRVYCGLLQGLDQAFNGSPETLGAAVGTMYAVKAKAQALMQMPDGDGTVAGPTFEYVRSELR